MKLEKINHIGIAVPELETAIATYQTMGFEYDGVDEVPAQKVKTAFFTLGESHIELLEPTAQDSPIAKFLEKRGAGIHHICVQVDNIDEALEQYRQNGVQLINEKPVIGAGGHRVAFVHPKATGGVLLELLEPKKD